MSNDPFNALRPLELGGGRKGKFYALAALAENGVADVSRLPVSIRIVIDPCCAIAMAERSPRPRAPACRLPAKGRTQRGNPFVVARIAAGLHRRAAAL